MSIPYMPLYVADYEADTLHLSTAEDGAFNRLMRLCWRTPGCSLPDDHEWIRRRVRVDQDEYDQVYRPVLDEFFKRDKGRVFNSRQQREHERINDTHQKRREAGRRGGRPPKSPETKTTGKSRAKANEKPGQSNQNQNQNQNQIRDTDVSLRLLTQAGVSAEVAEDFIAHRRGLRAKLTERATKQIVNKLDGHPDPDAVLRESIANGWRGVFPESVKQPKEGRASGSEIANRVGERFAARYMDRGPDSGAVVPLLPARNFG